MDLSNVTRVVIVRVSGAFAGHTVEQHFGVSAEAVLQDDGQTLKLFMTDHPEVSARDVHDNIRIGLSNALAAGDGSFGDVEWERNQPNKDDI